MIRRFISSLLAFVGITSNQRYTAGPVSFFGEKGALPPTHQPQMSRGRMPTRTLSLRHWERRKKRMQMQKRSRRVNRGLHVKQGE